jgi:hypothetical protein
MSFNRYSYVWNNPLNMTDPTGYNAYHDSYSGAGYTGTPNAPGIGGVSYGAGTSGATTVGGSSGNNAPTAPMGYFNFSAAKTTAPINPNSSKESKGVLVAQLSLGRLVVGGGGAITVCDCNQNEFNPFPDDPRPRDRTLTERVSDALAVVRDKIKEGAQEVGGVISKALQIVLSESGADNAGDQSANPRAPSKGTKEAADAQATDENGKLRCQYCGTELTKEPGHPNSREFDHFDPYKNGGSNTIDNILDACRTCNRGKGSKSYPDGWQPKYD